ncbi:MAG: hypothetical protein ABIF12_02735 [bacterium]
MLKFKKLFLFSFLLTVGNYQLKANEQNLNNIIEKFSQLSVENATEQKLKNMVEEISQLSQNIGNVTKEFENINNIKLKNSFIVGILKHFKGTITLSELQQLGSLENSFNQNTPSELLELITNIILSKSNNDKIQNQVLTIKNNICQKFEISNQSGNPSSLNSIKAHPVIKKIFNLAKSNPEKLTGLLNHIIENCIANGTTKTNLQSIANNISLLLY